MSIAPFVFIGMIVFFQLPRSAKETVFGLVVIAPIIFFITGALILLVSLISWKSLIQFSLVIGGLFFIGMVIGGIASLALGNNSTDKGILK